MAEAPRLDLRAWPLALRVVAVTVVLAALAIATVGGYISTVIADGLFEQRRARVLEESASTREDFRGMIEQSAGASTSQRQDSLTAYVQRLRTAGEDSDRSIAILPVDDAAGTVVVSSDRQVLDLIDPELTSAVVDSPEALTSRPITLTLADGSTWPGLIVGTRVSVAGAGSYDVYMVYSLEEEQRSLGLVQGVMLGGGTILLALIVGIGVVIARMVTAPLQEAAAAAERMSRGELDARMDVRGADELARVGLSFNDMADSLQQKVDDLTELSRLQHRFVSDVSHELRTPLTTIRMAASVIDGSREELPEQLHRTTELLTTQVDRFDALLEDLLEISRFDAGAATLDASRHRIDDVVQGTLAGLAPVAATRGVDIHWHPAGADVEAVLDPRRIDRILRNLLTNAFEHGAHGPVRVDARGDATGAVAVTVQDWGRGLSPEDARHVFDRFWRGDPSRVRTLGGTGLGLSIAVEDARLHGGWLQAWGQEGQGAVFRLTLPPRPQAELRSSPLPLERSFTDRGAEGSAAMPSEAPAVTADSLPSLTDPEEEE